MSLVRWREEEPHPPTADPLIILTASALPGPLSSALVSLPRRGMFCCPMCPETYTLEILREFFSFPQGIARDREMHIKTNRVSWSRGRTDQSPLEEEGTTLWRENRGPRAVVQPPRGH